MLENSISYSGRVKLRTRHFETTAPIKNSGTEYFLTALTNVLSTGNKLSDVVPEKLSIGFIDTTKSQNDPEWFTSRLRYAVNLSKTTYVGEYAVVKCIANITSGNIVSSTIDTPNGCVLLNADGKVLAFVDVSATIDELWSAFSANTADLIVEWELKFSNETTVSEVNE